MPTATGRLSLPLEHTRTILAACAAWRSWVGAATAAVAKASIHLVHLPGPGCGGAYTKDEIVSQRVHAIVDFPEDGEGFETNRIAGGSRHYFQDRGRVLVGIVEDVPLEPDASDAEVKVAFMNRLGALIGEVLALSASDDGVTAYLAVTDLAVVMGPSVSHEDLETGQGRTVWATLALDWGV